MAHRAIKDLDITRGTDNISFIYQTTTDGRPLLTMVCTNKYGADESHTTITQIAGEDFEKFKAYVAGLGAAI